MTIKKYKYPLPIPVNGLQYYHHNQPFHMELGGVLSHLTIGFHTYGKLNKTADNVIWVFHALTANSEVKEWWVGLMGKGKIFDSEKYFIVCANLLGSCYGTTGPRSINPETGEAFGLDFPFITIRDMVNGHECLREHLGIRKIHLAIGGSCGGHQVLEYAFQFPKRVTQMGLLVTCAKESAWAIAIHEAGRMSLENDPTFKENNHKSGSEGLKAARAIGLLGYRTIKSYINNQTDEDDRVDTFKASSYVRYQGSKLEQRFYAHCYWYLLKALDTHNVGRGRGGLEKALQQITIPALVLAIDSDMLIPPPQQKFLANHLANATYHELSSDFGHDGFLIETDQINNLFLKWLEREEG